MSISRIRLIQLVEDQLAKREMRLLTLIVAVRKELEGGEGFKGDLSATIKSILRQLVASKVVRDVEGTYVLTAPVLVGKTSH